MIAQPKKDGKYPCIIYNRGGNRDFGALKVDQRSLNLAKLASHGYIVIASQYRGDGGSEGQEEFGGKDVNDVLNLMDVLEEIQKESAFMYHFHDNKTIRDKMTAFKYIEPKLKAVIKETINEEDYQPVIDDELRDFLDFYITKDFFYYYSEEYEQSEVSIFQASLRNLQFLLEGVYLPKKKAYLEFHNELMGQL